MCDYSLHHVASRPAKVADKLVSTNFIGTITRGFSEVGQPNVAVCLLPGTEIAFEREVSYYEPISFTIMNVEQKVARFRQIDKDRPHVHHDALEFPDGQIVPLTHLCEEQQRLCCNCRYPRAAKVRPSSGRPKRRKAVLS